MLKAHFTNIEEAIKGLTFHSAGIPVMKCEFARSKVFFLDRSINHEIFIG
jgi:hypothetical protein